MRKKTVETVAAIDVGSNSIKMTIAQITSDGSINIIDDLQKNTNIGRDTFSLGKVTAETIRDTCSIISGYSQIMNEYGVKFYNAYSTSGIREAENKEYVLEQIKLSTGKIVSEINISQERFFIYKAIREKLSGNHNVFKEGTMILNTGAGGVEISVYDNNRLKFTQYVKIGALRIRELLSEFEKNTLSFSNVLDEFIDSKIYSLKNDLKKIKIKYFVGIGDSLKYIKVINNSKNDDFISNEEINDFYTTVYRKSSDQISNLYNITLSDAELLLPSIIIFRRFLNMTQAEGIFTPLVSLRDGMLVDMVDESFLTKRKKQFTNDIISSVWYIAEKYGVNPLHSAQVERISHYIFNCTKSIHKLGEKEKLYLRVGSILHDVGQYISLNHHGIHSYNIVMFENIIGFSERDIRIVANLVRYHSDETPKPSHENYRLLNYDDKIIVSKLIAILKLAESLDTSHKQKIDKFNIIIDKRNLIFQLPYSINTILEKWDFKNNSTFFEEVMGVTPIIIEKGEYHE